jgi:hypothetical protein
MARKKKDPTSEALVYLLLLSLDPGIYFGKRHDRWGLLRPEGSIVTFTPLPIIKSLSEYLHHLPDNTYRINDAGYVKGAELFEKLCADENSKTVYCCNTSGEVPVIEKVTLSANLGDNSTGKLFIGIEGSCRGEPVRGKLIRYLHSTYPTPAEAIEPAIKAVDSSIAFHQREIRQDWKERKALVTLKRRKDLA